jgi:hypothetical protein
MSAIKGATEVSHSMAASTPNVRRNIIGLRRSQLSYEVNTPTSQYRRGNISAPHPSEQVSTCGNPGGLRHRSERSDLWSGLLLLKMNDQSGRGR